jgi:hypothetical protein
MEVQWRLRRAEPAILGDQAAQSLDCHHVPVSKFSALGSPRTWSQAISLSRHVVEREICATANTVDNGLPSERNLEQVGVEVRLCE